MMDHVQPLYEEETLEDEEIDEEETPLKGRTLITQPYDLVFDSMMTQINDGTLHLRPLSARPNFQRKYVWTNKLASRLIESILLEVPIPPCYLNQNQEFELDVIDGQQRIYSIYRFLDNQFKLSNLEVLKELNGHRYHELERKLKLKLKTYTLRCVIISNKSDPEIKFDVFERLNTNTMPLNAQEIRNCIYRGPLNDALGELAEYEPWLGILGRRHTDKRLRDEELILRFFAFHLKGFDGYKTPQKHWLNDVAKEAMNFKNEQIITLKNIWKTTIDKCLIIFEPKECFRRIPIVSKSKAINRSLMDLMMNTTSGLQPELLAAARGRIRERYEGLFRIDEFVDLISRAVDHKKRTIRRHEIWEEQIEEAIR